MRKILACLLVLCLAPLLHAQVGRGNVYGQVVDKDGSPLPGVTVTLSGKMTSPLSMVTGPEGQFRFITLSPSNDYRIKAELDGFETKILENIEVSFGRNVNLQVELTPGAIKEEITVIAESPLVDKKRTEVGMVAKQEVLQEVPTVRSIFNIEKLAPAVHSRYWDVGGMDTGQDAGSARGQYDKYLTSYSLDGINITDMAARGSTAGGFNYNNIEEMNVVVGGAADVIHQTSGVSTNIILKRGSNQWAFWANAYLTDNTFQASNLTDRLRDAGITAMSSIDTIREFAFGVGGPVIRDKAWFYFNMDNSDKRLLGPFGEPRTTVGAGYSFKVNLQPIPQNRFEFYLTGAIGGGRRGDNPSPELPLGEFNGPDPKGGNFVRPFLKFMDEHSIGDSMYLSAQFVSQGGHYNVWFPMLDLDRNKLAFYNVTDRIWEGSAEGDRSRRPHYRGQFFLDYFNDKILGVSHEIRLGGALTKAGTDSEVGFAGNVSVRNNFNTPTVDSNGDGKPDVYPGIQRVEVERGSYRSVWTDYYAFFVQDKISFSRFNIQLGLRYDYQSPYLKGTDVLAVIPDHPAWTQHFSSAATNAIDGIIPAVQLDEIRAYDADGDKYVWANLSPRFAVTWDVIGDGRSIAKFSACKYNEWMASGFGSRWARGGTGGWMNFWWLDGNANGLVDLSELYWHNSATYALYRSFDNSGNFLGDIADGAGILYGSYDPRNPQKTTDPYTLTDGKTGAPRSMEFAVSFEQQIMRDFAVSVGASYRLYDNFDWSLQYFPATGQIESPDWYMPAGTPPASISGIGDTKEAKNYEWYVQKPEYGYTPWRYQVPREDYHIEYYGMDIIVNKRLADRWMLNGSFTLGKQAVHYGDRGLNNPTNKWAVEGKEYTTVSSSGGGGFAPGRIDNPLWMFKLMALYQLPWLGIDVSMTLNGQEGRDVRETFQIVDTGLPNPRSQQATLFMVPLGNDHSDNIFLLNLGIQKRVTIQEWGRLTFSIDVFNLFNRDTIHWRFPKDYGTYYVQSGIFAPNPGFYLAQDTFTGRVARLGMRFSF